MNEDFKMMPLVQPKRVLTRSFQNTEYKIRLARPITEIDDFEEEIMVFEEASEGDLVLIQLSSPGGSLETCDFICRRMLECQAPIVVEIGITCASAASAICLHADEWVIHDSSTMMIHACSYSPGWGKEVDVFASATYTNRINREWLERTYKGFLTDTEMQSVLDGKDLYFYADDLRERLPKYKEFRENQLAVADVDELDEDQSFDLMSLIEEKVEQGVDKALKKLYSKFDLTPKTKKAAERKPKANQFDGANGDGYQPLPTGKTPTPPDDE